jgi:DNA-binding LacI/PurR family transcriptional regulator/DNA-binding transcriptional regulator YhcF (GntR family)
MKREKSSPGVKKAFDFVKQHLEDTVWQPGEPLPATVSLARSAGVSPVTMLRALAMLKDQGLVNGIPRSRFRAGGSVKGMVKHVDADSAAWVLKRTSLEKDILAGVYAHQGALPSIKELEVRYGTCFRTMRKILRSMVDDGVVKLRGKKYEMQRVPDRAYSQRIVFITFQIQAIPRSALNQGQYQVLSLFERECINRGLKLEVVTNDFYNSIETRRIISSPSINEPALGYIFDLWWYPGEDFRRGHSDLFARLATLKKPVAILDEVGDFILPQPFAANPLFQVFRIEGKRAGARVARFLLGMGHQSVAFFSSSHQNAYSKLRLEGANEQFAKAGCPNGVRPIVTDKIENHLLHLLDISGFDEPLVRKVMAVSRTESQTRDLQNEYQLFKSSGKPEPLKPDDIKLLKKNMNAIQAVAPLELDKTFFDKITLSTVTEGGTRITWMSLAPLFEEALKYRDVTAWICVTDGTALAALDFLRNRGIAVPGRISLIGFDNEPIDAVEQRLTSLDFNALGFIHGMLNFIVRPSRPRGIYVHVPIEVEGIIIQRDTVAPPEGAGKALPASRSTKA